MLSILIIFYIPIISSILISVCTIFTMIFVKVRNKNKKYTFVSSWLCVSWLFQMFHYSFLLGSDIWFAISVAALSLSLIIYGILKSFHDGWNVLISCCVSMSYMVISMNKDNMDILVFIAVAIVFPIGISAMFEKRILK